jgi:hypothetical protein
VLSALSDFMSNDASPAWALPSNAPQAIEQASESPRLHARCSRHTAQALSINTVFRVKRHAAKPQNAADCHQFASTCPVLAA